MFRHLFVYTVAATCSHHKINLSNKLHMNIKVVVNSGVIMSTADCLSQRLSSETVMPRDTSAFYCAGNKLRAW